jgi:hypothetical protein
MQYLTKLLDKTSGGLDWIPLIAAIFVFATFQYSERISDVVGAVSIHLHSADLQSSLAVQARLSWGLVLFLYATVFVAAIAAMLSCFHGIYGIRGAIVFGSMCIAIGTFLSFSENSLSIGSATPMVRLAIAYHSLPAWPFEKGAIPGVLLAYLMIGVAISCLRTVPAVALLTEEYEREQAATRIEQLQSLLRRALYAAAAVLSVAMMFTSALHGLALPLTTTEEQDSVRQLALSVSSAQGTGWTAILVAIYAPAALILVNRSQLLAEAGIRKSNRKAQLEWLEKHGLSRSVGEQLSTAAAAFAPLLAGVSAKLIELI